MKKIISIITIISSLLWLNYSTNADSLTLSAVVGNSNHAPVVTEIIPNSNPRYLNNSTNTTLVKQNYSIKFRDDENDEVTYTITTQTDGWAVNPTSWTILSSEYDSNNEAYIVFEYISPTSEVWLKTITITISDWPNVTVQTLNVYIY